MASVFELFFVCLWANFLILLHILLFYSSVSSVIVINFSNFLCDDYKLYVVRIDADTNVWSRDRTVDGEGGRGGGMAPLLM